MTALATIAGLALVAIALRDVFETLFHPQGRGVISDRIVGLVWRGMRRLARGRRDLLSTAGPLAFMTVLLCWIALVVIGCALVIAPHMPDDYSFASHLASEEQGGFVEAVYLSLVNLTSLGYGDIVATSGALQLLGPVETMIGLGLLTASISWLLSIYTGLSDSRSLAREIGLLSDAERATGLALAGTEPVHAARALAELASKVIAIRRDLRHFPIAYYFHARDPRSDLSIAVGEMLALARRSEEASDSPAVALEARKLELAIRDLLETVADEFLGDATPGDSDRTLELWRRDHGWEQGTQA
jgi:hypothetical protein